MQVTSLNTVTASETLYTSTLRDALDPERIIVQNVGAAVLYINFDAAATNQHFQIAAGGSVELTFTTAQTLTGYCATTTDVVILKYRP